MKNELDMVREFHRKFGVGESEEPRLIDLEIAKKRLVFMQEEVDEYMTDGVDSGDIANIAKELCDVLYVTYGTIIEHGLQDKMEEVFAEVHRSNMTKQANEYKAKKGKGYREPNVEQFFQ